MSTTSSTPNPMYISAHSAEAILSDFRPLKLQTDTLTFLNLLLDHILANVITSSRSILTDRLKSALLKTIPTTIGKDALLEAEMELRAYWQRPNAVKPSASQVSASEYGFSIPSMIELMRLKCEAYSTLNDEDEDAQAENVIQQRLRSQGIDPPKSVIVAPAALYLTAILECICERILSSVGRVATRDSSKDAAGTHDLFVALCEDDAIYPIFKGSKVYESIESSLKHPSKPRRSKSFSRSERRETRDVQSADLPSRSRSRLSSESAASGALSGSVGSDNPPQTRTSQEKGKAIKLFRPSSDRDATVPSDVASRTSTSRKGFGAQIDGINNESTVLDPEEGNVTQDFDDLMRSGDTMRVSLTPDRLRTMETAKHQRQPHNTRPTGIISPNNKSRVSSAADPDGRSPPLPEQQYHGAARKPSLSHVDSIIEDEEPKETVSPRVMQPYKTTDVRARSMSASGVSHGLGQRVPRKPSVSSKGPPPSSGVLGRDPFNAPNSPPRLLRKVKQSGELIDIDDIMNDSEEGSESNPDPGDKAIAQARVPLYPVSKATKDLISFLEEGPPPEVQPARAATVSTVSLTPTTKSVKSSRLQRMMSKLSLSKEDRVVQDVQRGRGVGSASAPSTPLVSSVRSFGANNPPPFPMVAKPLPPPILSIPSPVPISPPPSTEPSPDDDTPSPITQSDRHPARKMSLRKAVPAWAEIVDQGALISPIRDTTQNVSTSPLLALPTPPMLNGQARHQYLSTPAPDAKEANGHTQDNHKPSQSGSPVPTPTLASTGLESPSSAPRENGNGRAGQSHQGTFRPPRPSRPNHRSPINDELSSSARRISGRQPQSPSAQPLASAPLLSESLALDMRKLMSRATTAYECRILLDTFLTRAGIIPQSSTELDTTPSDVEPLERTLVDHFLGTDLDGPQFVHVHLTTAEAEPHPQQSSTEHAEVQESDDLYQSAPSSPMDSASAVHGHQIVSAAIAVAS
ncbi:hypothetical protein F5148DRAFT_1208967 [Russula earlei]|uniref:Uncharacterized protein n=1 Tax=Russula earlei TaxID=71964 RepID=A0ACC0U5X0_9AGAM|nr:hypothetical protein F5148DRAFT_1208967 [Russula earlei]